MDTQRNHLIEAVLLSNQNKCLNWILFSKTLFILTYGMFIVNVGHSSKSGTVSKYLKKYINEKKNNLIAFMKKKAFL